jgi:translation initiation factor 1 (eIF-1/SUI1)
LANRNRKKKIPVKQEEESPLTTNPFGGLAIRGRDDPSVTGEKGVGEETPEPRVRRKLGEVVLRRERPPRGGSPAVVVGQFSQKPGEKRLDELKRLLSKGVGCSAKVEEGEIWVQADQPAKVAGLLRGEGYRARGVTE